ncbi:hypothetical protein BO70DRAFT_200517 [Aspergillus heteromorphus CBS 117.55]|uniref:Uncharacterized protein n=1 Tax=Aspergillus heteromorphus CBS 117.55 TaxID=1448321 RepID=A0A317WRF2_9EURO|nr:uncharacterized protein BO70DRAFT_200517 [Aspergillus heteromorphus CBS 117.55]PWY87697.1 hypothetical protein BO70DRAFT_200517 [Aspergillus heteromorphus CBS 117.55]
MSSGVCLDVGATPQIRVLAGSLFLTLESNPSRLFSGRWRQPVNTVYCGLHGENLQANSMSVVDHESRGDVTAARLECDKVALHDAGITRERRGKDKQGPSAMQQRSKGRAETHRGDEGVHLWQDRVCDAQDDDGGGAGRGAGRGGEEGSKETHRSSSYLRLRKFSKDKDLVSQQGVWMGVLVGKDEAGGGERGEGKCAEGGATARTDARISIIHPPR